MSLEQKIITDLKAALLAKDAKKLEALRAVKAALMLEKTKGGSSAEPLSEEKEIQLLQKMVKQRKESAEIFRSQGRADLAETEEFQSDVIENYLNNKYLSAGFISTFKQDVFNSISAYVSEVRCDLPDYLALINFTFTSALMKYFGHEIHGTRGYVYTYSPYIDDEFIEFIMMTPVLELDKKAMEMNLKQHLWNTRRGQLFYLPVIRENFPELMKMKTGRFYSPNQLLSPFYPLSVIPALIKKKKYQKKSSLGSEEWILKFIESFKTTNRKETEWSKFISLPGYDKNDFLEYAKYISLKYYLMD